MSNVNYLAQFAKSFNWAGFFLPKNVYHDCSKLYAFCRVLDDLVDEKTNLEFLALNVQENLKFSPSMLEQNMKNSLETVLK